MADDHHFPLDIVCRVDVHGTAHIGRVSDNG